MEGKPLSGMVFARFAGVRTFARLPHVPSAKGMDFAVLGVPFDTGASYRVGARFGPMAIRDASALLRPFNPFPAPGVDIFKHIQGVDVGDAAVVPGFIQESYQVITEAVGRVLDDGAIPIMLGGDHSVALATLRAVAKKHGPLALIQFDSHSDTWDDYWGQKYTHGTPFRRAVEEGILDADHSIQIGMRGPLYGAEDFDDARALGFDLVPTPEVRELSVRQLADRIRGRVQGRPCYLSFDIDFMDPAVAPGTGTPEVGGFFAHEAQAMLRELSGIGFVGFELVEVLPAYDHAEITSLLAANIVYEFISLIARMRGA